MSSSTPSSVLDLSNSDLFSPQKDTSELFLIPKFLTKSLPIQSKEQGIEIKEEETEVKEEKGEEFLRKDMESSSSSMRESDEVDDTDDGFRTPDKKITPTDKQCPPAPIKPKPPVPFLTRKRKTTNVKFLFQFDLAKEIQESLLHQVHQQHPTNQEFSRIIKKVRTV